jgi:hypothetical protein
MIRHQMMDASAGRHDNPHAFFVTIIVPPLVPLRPCTCAPIAQGTSAIGTSSAPYELANHGSTIRRWGNGAFVA